MSRIVLQEPIRIVATSSIVSQDPRYAARIVGGAKSGRAYLNMIGGVSVGTATMRLYTSFGLDADPNMQTSAPCFWSSVGVATGLSSLSVGLFTIDLSAMGEWLRWQAEGMTTGADFRFAIVVDTYDA